MKTLRCFLAAVCTVAHAAYECVPDVPPRAALIQVSAANVAGTATVTGQAGAVPAGSRVVLATLETGHTISTIAKDDGGFAQTIFAPPGTSILVKAGPARDFPRIIEDSLQCYPGTVVRPPDPGPPAAGIPVAAAGLTHYHDQSPLPVWTFQGTLDRQRLFPGETLRVAGTLRIESAAMRGAAGMTVRVALFLERLSAPGGAPGLGHNTLASALLTPTGLPIERAPDISRLGLPAGTDGRFDLTKTQETRAELAADWRFPLDGDLLAGYYRPSLLFSFEKVPAEPMDGLRLEMNRAMRESNLNPAGGNLRLPVIRVGTPTAPRLAWTLLTNDLSEGTRGTRAIEDQDRFDISAHVVTQAETFVVAHGGTYRLEPFVPAIGASNTGQLQSVPLIPFRFPSGRLTLRVERPDGSVVSVGPVPFAQDRMRTLELDASGHAVGGTLQEVYQLSTLDPRFDADLTQYGLHVITLEGEIEDIWGNTWSGGGTYRVYVAHPLVLDTAVLPGTPFEVGDAFAPGLTVSPAAAADIEVRFELLPGSDSARRIERVVRGKANRFGYFQPAESIALEQPGEYRVDVTASFRDRGGRLWMGSRTWGSVVAARNPGVVAHGQRGTDELRTASPQWFTRTQIGIPIGGDHVKFAFHSGDVMWLQETDSVRPTITFQDVAGTVLGVLQGRTGEFGDPSIGETFLQPSRPDGRDAHLDPGRVDVWAYAYTAVERPLVRVREEILGGATASPYWRFLEQYGNQTGTGRRGDEPNDIKFQYGGAVIRGLALTRPEYAIYGSLFVLVPDDDPLGGTRVFPPFQGNGGGPSGGPVMILKGREIDLFLHLTGVRPGSVLETGDIFAVAGAVGPTLAAGVNYTVTAPSGNVRQFAGRANSVGYYYRPADNFVVDEAGIHTVDLTVTFRGRTSAGQVSEPFPTGGVLGADGERFYVYVTPRGKARLDAQLPTPGTRTGGSLDASGLAGRVHVTATMPGFLLESRIVAGDAGGFFYRFNAGALARDFPNLDIDGPPYNTGDVVTIGLFDLESKMARVAALHGGFVAGVEPPPEPAAAVNAASFAAAITPGSFASLFGVDLALTTAVAASFPLPRDLGGVRVELNGVAAPLVYVSPGQINFLVPWELAGETQAVLSVNGAPINVQLAPASPGIFAVVRQGRFLVIYGTGLGPVTNPPATGAPAVANPLSETLATPTVIVGGQPARVLFSGLTPGFAGLYQVNVELPEVSGPARVVLLIGGHSSNALNIVVE